MRERLVALVLMACSCGPGRSEPEQTGTRDEGATEPVDAAPIPVESRNDPAVTAAPEAKALVASLSRHEREIGPITFEQLARQRRPAYLATHGLRIEEAEFLRQFSEAFELQPDDLAALHETGFVIPDSVPAQAGPVDLYYRVFAADLPVFVSLDSVLHAWHRSMDDIIEHTEAKRIAPDLARSLGQMTASLSGPDANLDALTYLWVARLLLGARDDETRLQPPDEDGWGDPGTESPEDTRAAMNLSAVPDSVRPRVERLVGAVLEQQAREIELFGEARVVDFGQFRPRSHYARTRSLSRFFRAMMWLGRIEIRLDEPRQQSLALALARASTASAPALRRIDEFYSVYVGRNTALSPSQVLEACKGAGHPECEADAMLPALAESEVPVSVGRLRTEDRPTLRVLPQRFAYDAWILAESTMPSLEPQVLGGRSMASAFDVAFVLGSDRALEHLADEMKQPGRAQLPRRLEALRRTFVEHPPLSLDDTMYNHWLGALAAASAPRVDDRFPSVMRTAAWHDHQLETVLGSWTELRHDTVLMVEQSEGKIGCQYPRGYVEPVPEAFRRLGRAAAHLQPLHASLDPRDGARVVEYLEGFAATMERLAEIAERELADAPMSAEDLTFLQRTVDRHEEGYGGTRSYDGWYPKLFWAPRASFSDATPSGVIPLAPGRRLSNPHFEGGRSEPVVTDVHTDIDNGRALTLGVGHPQLMIVAIDAGADGTVALYGGPTYDLRVFEVEAAHRMTDDQWRAAVEVGALPPRPAFTRSYR